MNKIVRLRADPKKVRVGVKGPTETDSTWLITIESRLIALAYSRRCNSVEAIPDTINYVLEMARKEIPGIDLDCQWAYEHPFVEH